MVLTEVHYATLRRHDIPPPCPAGILLGDPIDLLKQDLYSLARSGYPWQSQNRYRYSWEEWIELCFLDADRVLRQKLPPYLVYDTAIRFEKLCTALWQHHYPEQGLVHEEDT